MDKLLAIQSELKAPKGQYNSFGKYKYRSCEDILEAVKPLLKKYEAVLTISDDMVEIGERVYVKATATLRCGEQVYTNTAFAREPDDKKGMDVSQVTGTASSYARKYCLNGLFLIDDTKDADTDEYVKQTQIQERSNDKISDTHVKALLAKYPTSKQINNILEHFGIKKLEDMTYAQLAELNNSKGEKK